MNKVRLSSGFENVEEYMRSLDAERTEQADESIPTNSVKDPEEGEDVSGKDSVSESSSNLPVKLTSTPNLEKTYGRKTSRKKSIPKEMRNNDISDSVRLVEIKVKIPARIYIFVHSFAILNKKSVPGMLVDYLMSLYDKYSDSFDEFVKKLKV